MTYELPLISFEATARSVVAGVASHRAHPAAASSAGAAGAGAVAVSTVDAGAAAVARPGVSAASDAGGAHSSNPSRLQTLARHGIKLDLKSGAAQLLNAILLRKDLAGVKRLLALGVDPNSREVWEGRPTASALSAAIGNGAFEIAAVLRAAGANDVGLLSEAAAKGDLAQMTALLDAGANVDERSGIGETPLHFAVSQGQSAAATFLLERGANVNFFAPAGYTARALAQITRNQAVYMKYSTIDRLKPSEAKAAMDEIIAAIDAHKPDPNFRDEAGETALMCGAGIGSLIGSFEGGFPDGMDINAQRPDGMTALMIAIASQPKNAPKEGPGSVGTDVVNGEATRRLSTRANFVETLLETGADLSLRNKAGKTALDLAREIGNEEILELLEHKKPSR